MKNTIDATTVSAVPLQDEWSTINPSKMEGVEESHKPGDLSDVKGSTKKPITNVNGTTYLPIFTYASKIKEESR